MKEEAGSTKYVSLKNVQILIALLKEYNIRNLVLSPGGRNVPFVHSVENDPFFRCYSIVDERSAGFFGIGLIHAMKEPVAICCTSATAVCNYMSAVNEAYYQHLPLVVLTADRNAYYLNQDEEQMIPQVHMFESVCKTEVSLPIVKDKTDEWYCSRIVNEALSQLDYGVPGPVHINFQIENIDAAYDTDKLPEVHKIVRICQDDEKMWSDALVQLKEKRIMIIFGQHLIVNKELQEYLDLFCQQFNCVICADAISNLHCERQINTAIIANTCAFETMEELLPDIVITMGGGYVSGIRNWLKGHAGDFSHWRVSKDGNFADQFKNLEKIFVCEDIDFIKYFIRGHEEKKSGAKDYYPQWERIKNGIQMPSFPFSSLYAVQHFIETIPQHAKLHIANSNSIRLAQMFELNETVEVFCNRGCNGIDGSMSTFMGQASVSGEMCYLLIGDLSFFYDMNALWNRYINKNMRILLINNSGAGIFHVHPGRKLLPTVDEYTAAKHEQTAEAWAKSCGFYYISGRSKEEFDKNLKVFHGDNEASPVLFEVFTDKEQDAVLLETFYHDSKMKNLLQGKKSTLVKTALRRVIK